MNINLTTEPMPTTICLQPGCLLKKVGLNSKYLAEFLVHTLTGKNLETFEPQTEPIAMRAQCKDCALRVLHGGKAYLTEPEWGHLNNVGQWHHRRQRRSDR